LLDRSPASYPIHILRDAHGVKADSKSIATKSPTSPTTVWRIRDDVMNSRYMPCPRVIAMQMQGISGSQNRPLPTKMPPYLSVLALGTTLPTRQIQHGHGPDHGHGPILLISSCTAFALCALASCAGALCSGLVVTQNCPSWTAGPGRCTHRCKFSEVGCEDVERLNHFGVSRWWWDILRLLLWPCSICISRRFWHTATATATALPGTTGPHKPSCPRALWFITQPDG
jgi:hypothetical protein